MRLTSSARVLILYLASTLVRPTLGMADPEAALCAKLQQIFETSLPSAKETYQYRDRLPGGDNSQITEPDFIQSIQSAQQRYPKIFTAPTRLDVYRVDSRDPFDVYDAGGFWGNPEKKSSKRVEDHTLRGTGTREFVSASFEDNQPLLSHSDFMPKNLRFTFSDAAGFQPLAPSISIFLENPNTGDHEKVYKLLRKKSSIAWVGYQFRARNVLGTKIIGGRFSHEKEFITAGIPLRMIDSWRRVLIVKALDFNALQPTRDSVLNALTIQSGFNKKLTLVPQPWHPMTKPHPSLNQPQ